MKYKAILFDLDGTLADTSEGVYESVKYASRKLGLPEADGETLRKFIGPPLQYTFSHEYNLSEAETDKAVKAFREFYGREGVFMCTPYDGMEKLLRALRKAGYKVGTATYKREDYAIELLNKKFTVPFDVIKGADPDGKLTKAEIIKDAARSLGAELSETVLIGDTHFDAEGARNAGIDFIAVTYGFGFKSREDADKYPNAGCFDSCGEMERFFV